MDFESIFLVWIAGIFVLVIKDLYGILELIKGAQIKFRRILSENDTNKFKIGISSNGIDKKVDAIDGMVSHTFIVEESGLYDIFIENDETVSVTGTVIIK